MTRTTLRPVLAFAATVAAAFGPTIDAFYKASGLVAPK